MQQALIFGHAVPMPVIIRTRTYGDAQSYKDFGYVTGDDLRQQAAKDARHLSGPR